MDDPNGTLIGCHGYCTQEMVNLLLTGCAVSNVFDGTVMLDQVKIIILSIHDLSESVFTSPISGMSVVN